MAGNAVIGALRVVLGADTAALDKGLSNAQKTLANFANQAKVAGAVAAGALAGAIGGLAVSIKSTVDQADKLGKMSQKIGIPVEELSALKHAADLSDVSIESLGKAVGKLSKTMVEAAAKPTSEAANAFRALGISVTDSDGKIKSSSTVISEVAGKFENLKDGAGKTAISMAIFGKSGADLIPMLNAGKAGLAGMIAEAAELGIVIDTQTAKSSEEFNDNLTRLGKVKDAIILKITAGLLPAMEKLSKIAIDAAKNSDLLKAVTGALATAMNGVIRAAMLVYDNIGLIVKIGAVFVGAQIGAAAIAFGLAFVKLAVAIRSTGLILAAFEAIRGISTRGMLLIAGIVALAAGAFDGFSDKVKKLGEGISNMLPEGTAAAIHKALDALGLDASALTRSLEGWKPAAKDGTRALNDINYGALAGKNALDQFIASQQKSIEGQKAELQTIGMAAGAKEALKIQLQGLQVATEAKIPIDEAHRAKLMEVAAAAGEMALKIQGAQLVQQNLTPGEMFRLEMENNRLAMEKVGATSEQMARQAEKDAEKFGMSWSAIGTNIAGTAGALSNLTGTFAKENKAMGIASKAFGIGQAIINTQIAITKALATLPPPASYAAVALAVAQGAASVASISAQKFAMGGALRVPGGMGGGDKVPFHAMLEPGELVEVSSNRAGGYQSGSRAAIPPITLIGDTFSRASVEKLIDSIIDIQRDGAPRFA
jgi:hypothetical protein